MRSKHDEVQLPSLGLLDNQLLRSSFQHLGRCLQPRCTLREVLSTAGATILGVGYMLPLLYFGWSLTYGAIAGNNPWQTTGLEWQIQSPPLTENFVETPIMDHKAYDYEWLAAKLKREEATLV
jgi:cytochrome c oxidase subunit I